MSKKILILGGGTGGFVGAKALAEKAHKIGQDLEITLVTKDQYHEFQPLYADVAFGTASPDEVRAPIKNMEKYGIKVIIDKVTKIDPANRKVMTSKTGSLSYDYLIVSLAVDYHWDKYPGLDKYGYHNYTLNGAIKLGKALTKFKGGKLAVLVPETPHRCGMYPYEAATQLAESFAKRALSVQVTVYSPEPRPLNGLGPDISKTWQKKMEDVGVKFVSHKGLEEVKEGKIVFRGSEEEYDFLIKVPPSKLPEPLANSPGFRASDPRWAPARPKDFRHPDYDEIFMVGEHSMPPAGLPTAGIPVHFAADYAVEQIMNELTGGYPIMGYVKTMTCVGYFGTKGFAGTCELPYDERTGKRRLVCYTTSTSPIIRLMKEAFYKAWVASIK